MDIYNEEIASSHGLIIFFQKKVKFFLNHYGHLPTNCLSIIEQKHYATRIQ